MSPADKTPSEKEKLILTISETLDFDLWRNNHAKFTFEEQKRIYNDWILKCQDQRHYKKDQFFLALDKIPELEQLRILELGPYKGYLAFDILSKYKVKSYVGYDISDVAISLTAKEVLALGYVGKALDKQIWESADIPEFDIFISSDTVEHLTSAEAIKLFDWLESRAKYIIMYVEGKRAGESWAYVTASHILELTEEDIIAIFTKKNYETVTHSDKWFFFRNRMC